jgi:hypothetical protein
MKIHLVIALAFLTQETGFSQESQSSTGKTTEKLGEVKNSQVAPVTEPTYGFAGETIISKGYKFQFVSANLEKENKDYTGWGIFLFRWNGKQPVKIHGFGFEKNGDFQVRFEQVSRFRAGKWLKLPILSCGTGAELFKLQPGKDYKIQVSMWRFGTDLEYKADRPRTGDKGVVLIRGEDFSLVSDPFDLPLIPSKK